MVPSGHIQFDADVPDDAVLRVAETLQFSAMVCIGTVEEADKALGRRIDPFHSAEMTPNSCVAFGIINVAMGRANLSQRELLLPQYRVTNLSVNGWSEVAGHDRPRETDTGIQWPWFSKLPEPRRGAMAVWNANAVVEVTHESYPGRTFTATLRTDSVTFERFAGGMVLYSGDEAKAIGATCDPSATGIPSQAPSRSPAPTSMGIHA